MIFLAYMAQDMSFSPGKGNRLMVLFNDGKRAICCDFVCFCLLHMDSIEKSSVITHSSMHVTFL